VALIVAQRIAERRRCLVNMAEILTSQLATEFPLKTTTTNAGIVAVQGIVERRQCVAVCVAVSHLRTTPLPGKHSQKSARC